MAGPRASAVAQPSEGSRDASGADQAAVAFCRGYMAAYVESSARKLFRALSAQRLETQEITLPGWMMVDADTSSGGTERVDFDVRRERSGRVIGLVDTDRDYRRTLIAAMTEKGPVVATQRWPPRDELEEDADCRPTGSEITYPQVDEAEVAIEPFEYWGMRVARRLPEENSHELAGEESEGPTNIYELLKAVVGDEPRDESGSEDVRREVERELQEGLELE